MTEQYLEELIRKYAQGTASGKEVQQLMDWYHANSPEEVDWPAISNTEKEQVYNRMLSRLDKTIAAKPAKFIELRWLKVAAVILVFVGLAAIATYYLKNSGDSFVTITNPSGKILQVALPDSSQVWLNASTTLRYARSFRENRAIELEGEAYFRVSHDKAHPFIVAAGGIHTTVLGTAFNIKAYKTAATTTVSLITGSVRVSDSVKNLAILSPAMQLQFNKGNGLAKKNHFDTSAVLAWTQGQLRFTGETFAEIARALENWYGVKMVFANQGMQNCRYYMTFDNSISLEKLLLLLAEITDAKYEFDKAGNIITLSGKGCN